MERKWMTALVACAVMAMASGSYAQRESGRGNRGSRSGAGENNSHSGVIDYKDLSERNTLRTEREDRKKKAEEEAKKKAEEAKKKAEAQKRQQGDQDKRNGKTATTMTSSRGTSGTKTASRPGAAGSRATKPVNAGGGTDPTLREVTEVMLDAVKTQKVQFDPEKAKTEPGMLLLNEPRFDETQRTRAVDQGIGQPL